MTVRAWRAREYLAVLASVGAIALSTRAVLADDADVIARIGTTDVKTEEIRRYIETLDPRDQAALAANPALLNQTVRLYLEQRMVLKEALDKKWDERPEVAAQLERMRQAALVESYLQSVSKVPDDYPSDADIQNAYEANKTSFLVPRQFRLAQIFIALPKNADKNAQEKARRKLDEVEKQLKQKNADFGAIAAAHSDEPQSAKQRGEIGWVAENQTVPEIRKLAEGLAKGEIGEPIRLEDGWHIVQLIDTKSSATRPLAELRDQIAQQLRAQRAAEIRRAYVAKLLEQSPPAINELALSKVLAKSGKQVP